VDDETRNRLVACVMTRDRVSREQATAIVNRLAPHDLTRLEIEARDNERPAFTSDYDPNASLIGGAF
jgi:hypothetical protein